jgi:hypothetical protein
MRQRSSPSWPKTYSFTEAPREVLELVARLMRLLLAGDHPTCALLRHQYARATIRQVTLTGVGFFVDFEVPLESARTAPEKFAGGDVNIQVDGVEHGAGCLLFVRDGVLSMLEGYTYGEEWPEHAVVRELRDAIPVVPGDDGLPRRSR